MHKNTEKKLKAFIQLDTWNSKSPEDMQRFYEFVIEAYNSRDTSLSSDEFAGAISPIRKLTEDELLEWYKAYENGMELLKVYKMPKKTPEDVALKKIKRFFGILKNLNSENMEATESKLAGVYAVAGLKMEGSRNAIETCEKVLEILGAGEDIDKSNADAKVQEVVSYLKNK